MPDYSITTPNTFLEAANQLLAAVGQSEVASLESTDTNEEVQKAVTAINNANRAVQLRGWHCNEEEVFALSPDPVAGTIALPANTAKCVINARTFGLRAVNPPGGRPLDLTQRGLTLYDRANHTAAIGQTVWVDITFLLPFEQLPPPLRWYVTSMAGRMFAVGRDPDQATYKFTKAVEDDAYAQALHADDEARQTNLVETSMHAFRTRQGMRKLS